VQETYLELCLHIGILVGGLIEMSNGVAMVTGAPLAGLMVQVNANVTSRLA
jgi:hypothetical protein